MKDQLDRTPWAWLLLGALLLVASQMRVGMGVLAWIAPVSFLHYIRLTSGWRSRVVFWLVNLCAWSAVMLKITTHPLPAIAALGWAVPFSVVFVVPYLTWPSVRRQLGENAGTLTFGTMMVVGEWTLHAALPLGVWGSAANTQLDQLALLQLSSVTGLHGVSFLIYTVAAVLERLLNGERSTVRRAALVAAAAVAGTIAFGQARLGLASFEATPTRLVAAVGTDSVVGTEPDLPTEERLRQDEQGLMARTETAAQAGAELVVWNEGATMVWPEQEEAWLDRLSQLANRLGIDLVAAYVVPLQTEPLFYENKYVFVRADGTIDHTYFKHEPVPGEPAVRGDGPMPLVEDARGNVGGAICYDYDFPNLALGNARNGADLVALPSSDWRGIDPIHTQMAAVRAIEGGTSVLRSTRFGLSAGIDSWGRIRGWHSAWDDEQRVLLVHLPRRGVETVYAALGDWFPTTCGLFSLFIFGVSLRRRLAGR
ncbi:MAG: hypothetical protein B7733_06050 [Myxococcales bacterium FL481]|nr:MAG: hypothetical protein B7733_06050 [Myxococcales bacterium FL481]